MSLIKKTLSVVLSAFLFIQGTVLAHAAEANFWKERNKAFSASESSSFRRRPESSSSQINKSKGMDPGLRRDDGLKLAALPANIGPALPLKADGFSPLNLSAQISSQQRSMLATNHIPLWIQEAVSPYATLQQVVRPATQNSGKTILLVQDVHLHSQAQKNITEIVSHLAQALKQRSSHLLVGMEGAGSDTIDFSAYAQVPDRWIMNGVAEAFRKANILNGTEAAAIGYKEEGAEGPVKLPMMVIGVEDRAQFEANVQAIKDGYAIRPKVQKQLTDFERQLAARVAQISDKDVRSLQVKLAGYHAGKVSVPDYVVFLDSLIPTETPELKKMLDAALIEGSLNFAKVESQRNRLLEALVKSMTKEQVDQLLQISLAFRSGQISTGDYFAHLKTVCQAHEIDLSTYPEMNLYVQYVIKSESISAAVLLEELARQEERAVDAMAKSAADKNVLLATKQFYLTKKLTEFTMTEAEWNEYTTLANSRSQTLNSNQSQNSKIKDSNLDSSNLNLSSSLEFETRNLEFKPFESFYRIALSRNTTMASKMAARLRSDDTQVGVLVAGGFHTDGLAKELRQSGFTVLTLSPKITETGEGLSSVDVLASGRLPLDRLFAGERLFTPVNPMSDLRPAELGNTVKAVAQSVKAELAGDKNSATAVSGDVEAVAQQASGDPKPGTIRAEFLEQSVPAEVRNTHKTLTVDVTVRKSRWSGFRWLRIKTATALLLSTIAVEFATRAKDLTNVAIESTNQAIQSNLQNSALAMVGIYLVFAVVILAIIWACYFFLVRPLMNRWTRFYPTPNKGMGRRGWRNRISLLLLTGLVATILGRGTVNAHPAFGFIGQLAEIPSWITQFDAMQLSAPLLAICFIALRHLAISSMDGDVVEDTSVQETFPHKALLSLFFMGIGFIGFLFPDTFSKFVAGGYLIVTSVLAYRQISSGVRVIKMANSLTRALREHSNRSQNPEAVPASLKGLFEPAGLRWFRGWVSKIEREDPENTYAAKEFMDGSGIRYDAVDEIVFLFSKDGKLVEFPLGESVSLFGFFPRWLTSMVIVSIAIVTLAISQTTLRAQSIAPRIIQSHTWSESYSDYKVPDVRVVSNEGGKKVTLVEFQETPGRDYPRTRYTPITNPTNQAELVKGAISVHFASYYPGQLAHLGISFEMEKDKKPINTSVVVKMDAQGRWVLEKSGEAVTGEVKFHVEDGRIQVDLPAGALGGDHLNGLGIYIVEENQPGRLLEFPPSFRGSASITTQAPSVETPSLKSEPKPHANNSQSTPATGAAAVAAAGLVAWQTRRKKVLDSLEDVEEYLQTTPDPNLPKSKTASLRRKLAVLRNRIARLSESSFESQADGFENLALRLQSSRMSVADEGRPNTVMAENKVQQMTAIVDGASSIGLSRRSFLRSVSLSIAAIAVAAHSSVTKAAEALLDVDASASRVKILGSVLGRDGQQGKNSGNATLVTDSFDTREKALSWKWKSGDVVGFAKWGNGEATMDLSKKDLSNLAVRYVASGDQATIFNLILTDASGKTIEVSQEHVIYTLAGAQRGLQKLSGLAKENPGFDWSKVKPLAFKAVRTASGRQTGELLIREPVITDVSVAMKEGMAIGINGQGYNEEIPWDQGENRVGPDGRGNQYPFYDRRVPAGRAPVSVLSFAQIGKTNVEAQANADRFLNEERKAVNGQFPHLVLEFKDIGVDVLDRIINPDKSVNLDYQVNIWAQKLKGLKRVVLVRPLHESNGSWYDWKVQNKEDAEKYIQAWNRIVKLFKAQGATNVLFAFSPHDTDGDALLAAEGQRKYDMMEYVLSRIYDTVDVVALDVYDHPDGGTKYFNELVTPLLQRLKKYEIPIIIGESSAGIEADKENFWNYLLANLHEGVFPEIAGYYILNEKRNEGNKNNPKWIDFRPPLEVTKRIQQDAFFGMSSSNFVKRLKSKGSKPTDLPDVAPRSASILNSQRVFTRLAGLAVAGIALQALSIMAQDANGSRQFFHDWGIPWWAQALMIGLVVITLLYQVLRWYLGMSPYKFFQLKFYVDRAFGSNNPFRGMEQREGDKSSRTGLNPSVNPKAGENGSILFPFSGNFVRKWAPVIETALFFGGAYGLLSGLIAFGVGMVPALFIVAFVYTMASIMFSRVSQKKSSGPARSGKLLGLSTVIGILSLFISGEPANATPILSTNALQSLSSMAQTTNATLPLPPGIIDTNVFILKLITKTPQYAPHTYWLVGALILAPMLTAAIWIFFRSRKKIQTFVPTGGKGEPAFDKEEFLKWTKSPSTLSPEMKRFMEASLEFREDLYKRPKASDKVFIDAVELKNLKLKSPLDTYIIHHEQARKILMQAIAQPPLQSMTKESPIQQPVVVKKASPLSRLKKFFGLSVVLALMLAEYSSPAQTFGSNFQDTSNVTLLVLAIGAVVFFGVRAYANVRATLTRQKQSEVKTKSTSTDVGPNFGPFALAIIGASALGAAARGTWAAPWLAGLALVAMLLAGLWLVSPTMFTHLKNRAQSIPAEIFRTFTIFTFTLVFPPAVFRPLPTRYRSWTDVDQTPTNDNFGSAPPQNATTGNTPPASGAAPLLIGYPHASGEAPSMLDFIKKNPQLIKDVLHRASIDNEYPVALRTALQEFENQWAKGLMKIPSHMLPDSFVAEDQAAPISLLKGKTTYDKYLSIGKNQWGKGFIKIPSHMIPESYVAEDKTVEMRPIESVSPYQIFKIQNNYDRILKGEIVIQMDRDTSPAAKWSEVKDLKPSKWDRFTWDLMPRFTISPRDFISEVLKENILTRFMARITALWKKSMESRADKKSSVIQRRPWWKIWSAMGIISIAGTIAMRAAEAISSGEVTNAVTNVVSNVPATELAEVSSRFLGGMVVVAFVALGFMIFFFVRKRMKQSTIEQNRPVENEKPVLPLPSSNRALVPAAREVLDKVKSRFPMHISSLEVVARTEGASRVEDELITFELVTMDHQKHFVVITQEQINATKRSLEQTQIDVSILSAFKMAVAERAIATILTEEYKLPPFAAHFNLFLRSVSSEMAPRYAEIYKRPATSFDELVGRAQDQLSYHASVTHVDPRKAIEKKKQSDALRALINSQTRAGQAVTIDHDDTLKALIPVEKMLKKTWGQTPRPAHYRFQGVDFSQGLQPGTLDQARRVRTGRDEPRRLELERLTDAAADRDNVWSRHLVAAAAYPGSALVDQASLSNFDVIRELLMHKDRQLIGLLMSEAEFEHRKSQARSPKDLETLNLLSKAQEMRHAKLVFLDAGITITGNDATSAVINLYNNMGRPSGVKVISQRKLTVVKTGDLTQTEIFLIQIFPMDPPSTDGIVEQYLVAIKQA